MKHLGIDYGEKRIGVALSDEAGRVAFPRGTIEAGAGAFSAVDALVKQEGVQKIVIGEASDLAGQPNRIMEDIAQFKKDLEELCAVPVEYEKEFFTSALAARQFAPEEKSRKKNPEHKDLDASAAALILQSYLDRNN